MSQVLFDTLVAKSYGALGTIVYGGLLPKLQVEELALLQFKGLYQCAREKLGEIILPRMPLSSRQWAFDTVDVQ